MSKIEQLGAKAALPVGGGAVVWPFTVGEMTQYANMMNQLFIPTMGFLIALVTLLIKLRVWWRGSRWSQFSEDESGRVRAGWWVGGSAAAVIALGLPITAKWEGLENQAYWDSHGQVWTVCYGETAGVQRGDQYSDAECLSMLQERWGGFHRDMIACAPQLADAPVEVQAAVTSWAYNVGTGAACKSTLARHLRKSEWREACNQLPRWRRAGGQVLRGLVNRRADEQRLCLSGL